MLIDSHAHLDSDRFSEDLDEVLDRAWQAGVGTILTIGCLSRRKGPEAVLELLEKHPCVQAAFGVHPHDSSEYPGRFRESLRELAGHPRVVAIGEIGLDFFYTHSPREDQLVAFRSQTELALERGLPIIVHSRDSEEATLQVLREYFPASSRDAGVLHCFSGSSGFAASGIEMGFSIGLGGVLTFKKSDGLRRIAAELPADRLLVETDCPYLSPEPGRGARNEPAFVVRVAEKLAEIREVSMHEVAGLTTANFRRIFSMGRVG